MGCGGSAPKPDPAIGQAALMNAQIAQESFAVGREQLAFEREQWDKLSPYYEEMFKGSVEDASKNRERSDFAWDKYMKFGSGLEDQFYRDAATYDSPAETARREGLASATVQKQIDASRGDVTREIGRMGGSAARAGQTLTDDANEMALAKAGAINQERNNTKLTGMALREGAVQVARGLPTMGLATGAAAQGNQGAAQGTAASGQGFRAGGLAMYSSPTSVGVNANNSTAAILNAQYQNQMQGYQSNQSTYGALAGAGATLGAAAFIF